MSELINRIYDVEAISKEVGEVLSLIGASIKEIEKYKQAIIDLQNETRKSKSNDELIKNSKLLNDTVIKGGVEMKRYEAEVQKLKEKTEQLTTSEKQANIEIAKARLELQAAQKATKEAALAEIEAAASTKTLTGSYSELQKDLKKSIDAYKNLSAVEREGAAGKELLKKIGETQGSLKSMDASMGNYQRNVGNYASALDGIAPGLGGLASKLFDISKSAKQNAKDWGEMGNSANIGIASMGQAPAGLAKITAGFKGLGQMVVAVGRAVLANPILAVIAAIVLIIRQVSAAISESEERSNKLSLAFAKLKPIVRAVGDVFEIVADVVIATIGAIAGAIAAVTEFIGLTPKGAAAEFERAEKLKQDAIIKTRKLNEDASEQEAIIAEQREILSDKENYSYKQRVEALRKAGVAEKKLSNDRLKAAELNLKALQAEAALDDNNAAMNDKLSAAIIAVNNARRESAAIGRKLGKEQQKLSAEHQADLKAEADAAKAAGDKIIAARRRLIDSQFALLKDSEEKSLKVSAETFSREIEDLRRNGELTKELRKNIEAAAAAEQVKIKKEWQTKKINEDIKADELVLENLKKSGSDTLSAEKELINKRMQAEILAGGNEAEIRKKYKYLLIDVEKEAAEKKYKAFEDQLKKDVDALTENYKQQESVIKKQYADGIISREEYENKVKNLRAEAEQAANAETIKLLTKELDSAEISADKRAELSKRIADLTIANENAVVDATIAANEEKLKSDAEAAEKRKQIAEQLIGASMELFSAIGEFQAQESERRIAEYEKEQAASDASFEKQQENLDNAIMSDETRAQKQKEIDEDKAANDKRIADKIQAEKIRQAKWSKAQSITEAIINTAGSIATTSKNLGFPLAIPFIALAAATGALQVATIAKQPIAAYEKGGITSNEVALWGEKRPEIAVTPSGEAFLATKPTISKFDAGTKIYKDVSDYERAIASQSLEKFTFDYDKMAGKIPQNSIVLDSRGLWGIVSRQNRRSTLINRRYKI